MQDRDQRLRSAAADHDAGRLTEAERAYRGLLAERPDDAEAMHLLGVLLHQSGRNDQALEMIRRSLELDGSRPNVHSNFASVLGRTGHAAEALHHVREALRLAPNLPEAHNNLGVTLEGMNRPKEAEPAYRRAIELRPTYAEAYHHLGNSLRKQGRMDEAAAAHRHAVSLRPAYADALAALGNVLMEQGLSEEGVDCLRRAAELSPAPAAGSSLLYTMHYLAGRHEPELSAAHFAWAARYAEPLGRDVAGHENDPSTDRRLRVGYVSPDFRDHTVPRFFEPTLDRHDRGQFEVICYSDTHVPDATTRRLQPKADIWRETRGMPHAALADLVRQDRIDILVDLRGHAGDNRMLLFALRPAPVQVSMVGYFNTTGQSAIGYRITDALQDPFGCTAAFHAESLVRLEAGCWCYRPDDQCPAVTPLPATRFGRITFASLNKLAKVSDPCARLWARVLEAVPGSRLVLAATGGEAGNRSARQRLQSLGIPADRLELLDKARSRADYLGRFGSVNIALDPLPFCGITTTCDALWQGVPTVSLAGDTPVSRAGLSILSAAGLPDWVAETHVEYVYNFTLAWTGTATANSVTFNWGDGTSPTTVSGSSLTDPYVIAHTYTTTGRFTPNAQVTPSSGSTVTVPLSLASNFGSSSEPGPIVSSITTGQDAAYAEVIQSNSDIVTAGVSNGNSFELERWTPTGQLDDTFGSSGVNGAGTAGGGKEDISFGGGTSDEAYAVAIDSSGDIIAAGTDSGKFAIVMLTPAGVPDASFGGGTGMVTTSLGSNYTAVATSVLLQPLAAGGYTIVVGGYASYNSTACCSACGAEFAISRYTMTGALDSTFNGTGMEILPLAPGTDHDYSQALVLQTSACNPNTPSDDFYVMGGYACQINSSPLTANFALTRLSNSGGTTSFGSSCNWALTDIGIAESSGSCGCCGSCGCGPNPSLDSDYALLIEPSNGDLVAAGTSLPSVNSNGSFALARYSASGILDTSFGTNGVTTTSFGGNDVAYAATLETVGSNTDIVAAGTTTNGLAGSGSGNDFAIARYTPSGSLDSTFGSGGKITTDIAEGEDSAQAIALDPTTGALVVAGSTGVWGNLNFGLAAYLPDNRAHITLPAPTGVAYTPLSTSSIKISWSAETGASSWVLQRSSNNGVTWTTLPSAGATLSAGTTSYTDTALTAGTVYDYALAVNDSSGDPSPATVISAATLIGAPTGVAAAANSDGSATVTWTPGTADVSASGASSFYVYRLDTSQSGASYVQLPGPVTNGSNSFNDPSSGLTPGNVYTYQVQAVDPNNPSQYWPTSAASNAVTAATPMPTGVTASVASGTEIDLNWSETDPNAVIMMQRSATNGVTWSEPIEIGSGSGPGTWFDTGLQPGTHYLYTLYAVDGTTSSQQTTPVGAWTGAAIPSSVTATANGSGSITVAWAGGPGDGAFTIYESTDGTDFSSIGSAPAGSTSLTVGPSGLTDGVTYWFEVSAADVNNGGSTPNSDPDNATATPQPPTNLAVTSASASGIALQWTNGDSTLDEVVQRSPAGADDWTTVSGPTLNATTFTDASVTPGTAYDYQVYSQDSAGNQSPAVQVSAFAGTLVTAGSAQTIDTVVGQTYAGELATLSGAGSATNLSGTIFWDDGSSSPATITPISGGGDAVGPVSGDTHAYGNAGTYSGSVVIDDVGDSSPVGSADLPFTAVVAPAPVAPGAAESVSAEEGIAIQVASFTDLNDGGDDAQNMTANLVCSNGTTIAGTVVVGAGELGSGSYSVQAAFPDVGAYSGTVHITDGDGQTGSVAFTADVVDAPLDAYGPPGSDALNPETISPVLNITYTGQVGVFYDEAGSDSNPADLSGTIFWGDGSSISASIVADGDGGNYEIDGSNLYSAAGTYNGYAVVDDADGSSTTVSFSAIVVPTAPLDAGNPETIAATEGQTFTGEVGTFVDEIGDSSDAGNLSATIAWGDGNTATVTPVALGGGEYSVQGTNVYAASGTLSGTVTVTEGSGTSTTTLGFTANVASPSGTPGPAVVPGAYTTITTNEGGVGFTGQVATFVDSGPGTLSATINWGDGNTRTGTVVSLGGDTYGIQGSNTFEDQGSFFGDVQVTDTAGGSANIGFAATVGPYIALEGGSPETITGDTGQVITAEVATFTDVAGDTSTFSATIDWGNGDTSEANLVPLGGGSYSVQGSETYSQSGSYAGTVTITDVAGDATTLSFTAEVRSYGPSNNALPGQGSETPDGSGITMTAATAASLQADLNSIAADRADGQYAPHQPVTINLTAGGTYTVTSPIIVSAGDSYVTLNGKGATLSGGATIDNWTEIGSTGEYEAPIGSLGVFRNLYIVNGQTAQRAVRTQSPEYGPGGVQEASDSSAKSPYYINIYGTIGDDETWYPTISASNPLPTTVLVPQSDYQDLQAEYLDETLSNGVPANPMEFVAIHGFDEARFIISNVEPDGPEWALSLSNLTDAHSNPFQFTNDGDYYIDNFAQGYITDPAPPLSAGQWYEDLKTGYVYYKPFGGAAPTSAIVPTANSAVGSLLEIGATTCPAPASVAAVTDFSVNHLTFSYAGWTEPSTVGYVGEQNGLFNTATPGSAYANNTSSSGTVIGSTYSTEQPAVSIADATGTTVEYCTFTHLGGAGLGLICQTSKSQIIGNTFTDISGSAVIVDGVQTYQDLSLLNSTLGTHYKSIAEFASDDDSITGGSISDCGVEFPDSAGVPGFAQDLTIGGIAISNLPADGIADGRSLNSYNGEYDYWYDPGNSDQPTSPPAAGPPGSGTWCVCTIKNNMIHDVCLVMSDEGGIYLSGCNWDFDKTGQKGTFVEGNTIQNVELEKSSDGAPVVQPTTTGYVNGIYVDSGAIGVSIENNHLLNIGNEPIFIHDLKTYLSKTLTGADGQFLWNEAPKGLALLTGSNQHASATAELAFGNTPTNYVIK